MVIETLVITINYILINNKNDEIKIAGFAQTQRDKKRKRIKINKKIDNLNWWFTNFISLLLNLAYNYLFYLLIDFKFGHNFLYCNAGVLWCKKEVGSKLNTRMLAKILYLDQIISNLYSFFLFLVALVALVRCDNGSVMLLLAWLLWSLFGFVLIFLGLMAVEFIQGCLFYSRLDLKLLFHFFLSQSCGTSSVYSSFLHQLYDFEYVFCVDKYHSFFLCALDLQMSRIRNLLFSNPNNVFFLCQGLEHPFCWLAWST